MMRRRALAATPWLFLHGPGATQTTVPPRRIGVLAPSTARREAVTLAPFYDEMERLGWAERRTVVYERRFADDRQDELPRLARELVETRPDLIFAPPLPAALAAQAATRTIPIVFATGTDPVGVGLVQTLSRPGGNATGLISVVDSLAPKSLQILKEVAPKTRRIALLGDPADPRLEIDRRALEAPVAALGIVLTVAKVGNPVDLEPVLQRLVGERVDAVMTNSSLAFNLREAIVQHLKGSRVVLVGHRTEMAEAGALFAYGAVLSDHIRRAAVVADKILRGTSPGTIAVEQPNRFELAINRRTAATLGIPLPRSLLLRADRLFD